MAQSCKKVRALKSSGRRTEMDIACSTFLDNAPGMATKRRVPP
jgi:hypothetical protein